MKNLILVSLAGFLFVSASAKAESKNEDALAYYKESLTALENKQYKLALSLANKAIELVPESNGEIEVNHKMQRRLVASGFGQKVVSTEIFDTKPYQPKRVVNEIEQMFNSIRQSNSLAQKRMNPPNLIVRANIIDYDNNGILDATERARINIIVENRGQGHADQVLAKLEGPAGISLPEFTVVKRLAPGEKHVFSKTFTLPKSYRRANLSIIADITEFDRFSERSVEVAIDTRRFLSPQLSIVKNTVLSDRVKTTEQSMQYFEIRNTGKGIARDIKLGLVPTNEQLAEIISPLDVALIRTLKPGESKTVSFELYASPLGKIDQDLGIVLSTNERNLDEQSHNLGLVIEQEAIFIASTQNQKLTQRKIKPQTFLDKKARSKKNETIVLLIGNSEYSNMNNVAYAQRDLELMRKTFRDSIGVPAENIYSLRNATLGDFNRWFGAGERYGRLGELVKANPNAEIHVYYSGHGFPSGRDNKPYLMPVDSSVEQASDTAVNLEQLVAKLDSLPVKTVNLYLDACYSGVAGDGRNLYHGISPGELMQTDMDIEDKRKTNVFSAASVRQTSSWFPAAQNGLFTFYLAQGMQGRGDLNEDNALSADELATYVSQKVPELAAALGLFQQNPETKLSENRAITVYR